MRANRCRLPADVASQFGPTTRPAQLTAGPLFARLVMLTGGGRHSGIRVNRNQFHHGNAMRRAILTALLSCCWASGLAANVQAASTEYFTGSASPSSLEHIDHELVV